MSNTDTFILTHLNLIVSILAAVIGAVWLSVKMFGKTYIEEAVKQGFRKEMAQQELINRHKFSLADEQRKAIYDFSDALYTYFTSSIFMKVNPKYFMSPELLHAVTDIINGSLKIGIASEKLSLLFIDNDEQLVWSDWYYAKAKGNPMNDAYAKFFADLVEMKSHFKDSKIVYKKE